MIHEKLFLGRIHLIQTRNRRLIGFQGRNVEGNMDFYTLEKYFISIFDLTNQSDLFLIVDEQISPSAVISKEE